MLDLDQIRLGLKNLGEGYSMPRIAKETGIAYTTLLDAISPNSNPTYRVIKTLSDYLSTHSRGK